MNNHEMTYDEIAADLDKDAVELTPYGRVGATSRHVSKVPTPTPEVKVEAPSVVPETTIENIAGSVSTIENVASSTAPAPTIEAGAGFIEVELPGGRTITIPADNPSIGDYTP